MSAGVLSIAAVVAQLTAAATTLREVLDTESWARARNAMLTPPMAFVLPLADRAGPNRYAAYETAQEVTARFAVMIVARDIGRGRGSAALSELEVIRREVRTALIGWTPPEASSGCLFSGGRIVSNIDKSGMLIWQDDWTTTLDLRSAP